VTDARGVECSEPDGEDEHHARHRGCRARRERPRPPRLSGYVDHDEELACMPSGCQGNELAGVDRSLE
jgi:hypothetical protein